MMRLEKKHQKSSKKPIKTGEIFKFNLLIQD